jgi:hypothetical protein
MAGSENRKRVKTKSIRFTPAELASVEAAAARAGLTTGGYLRQAVLDAPPPRQSRRPVVEKELLALLLRHLGKIGSNVNQLARSANSGHAPDVAELRAACVAVTEARDMVLVALGMVAAPADAPKGGGQP